MNTEGYVVDIYNSSLRTVLGWPENPPRGGTVNIPPEPKKSDYVSTKQDYHGYASGVEGLGYRTTTDRRILDIFFSIHARNYEIYLPELQFKLMNDDFDQ